MLIRFSVSSLVMLGHIVLSWNRSSGRGRNAPLFGKELYDTPPHARTGILGLGVTFTHARPPAPRREPFTTACPRNLREFQKYSQNMTGFLKIWKASATAGKKRSPSDQAGFQSEGPNGSGGGAENRTPVHTKSSTRLYKLSWRSGFGADRFANQRGRS